MTDRDLQYALNNGIINTASIQSIVDMSRRKELLSRHPYKIWEGTDGKWHTYLPDEKKGRVSRKRNSEEEIEDVIVEYWKTVEENPTIKELFKKWNDDLVFKGLIKTNTSCRNESCFKRHFTEFGEKRIKDTDLDMWVEFLEGEIPKYNLTAKSFAGLKSISKGILKISKRKKYIDFSAQEVMEELMLPKNGFYRKHKSDEEEVYTADETALILDHCKQNRDVWGDCITLIFVTGLRVGEAVALKHDDLDPKNLCISVHATESRKKDEKGVIRTFIQDSAKTDAGTRTVVLPKQYQYLLTSLWWASSNTEYVFEYNKKRIHTNAVRKKLARVCKLLGVPYKSPHKIRKTFCSILLDNNISSSFVTSQMGHTDITTSEIFYHKNRNSGSEKVEILSSIKEFAN